MFLTALECHSAGLVFASVHDSYWTHACDIDTMSDIIRDTFVRLHSQDILVRLRDEFLQRYKGYKVPASSLTGSTSARMRAKTKMMMGLSEDDDGELGLTNEPGSMLDHDIDGEADDDTDGDSSVADKPIDIPLAHRSIKPDAHGFYELADLLPPIPKKGDFDVSEIKRSLYFFS